MKIVFMGTPDFAVPALNAICDAGHDVGIVITQPDRVGNRGKVIFSPVKTAANAREIKVIQPENVNDDETIKTLTDYSPDVIVVVAYGQILRNTVLEIPNKECLNIHASLLPKLRGASPIQRAILDGDEYAGVTIMKVEEGLDSGPMLMSEKTAVDHKNFEELHDELADIGARLIVKSIDILGKGTYDFIEQDESKSTYSGIIKKSDGMVDFSKPATEIERMIRAFDPWPGAFFDSCSGTIKIWKASAIKDAETDLSPGVIVSTSKDGIEIATGEGTLKIHELQLPGKKRVKARDFLLGHDIKAGERL